MRALHSTRKASSDLQVLSRARSSNPSGGNPSFGGRVVLEGQRYRFVLLPYPGWSQTLSWYQDETSTGRTAVKTFRRVSCLWASRGAWERPLLLSLSLEGFTIGVKIGIYFRS